MNEDTVIKLENVSLKFRLQKEKSSSLKEFAIKLLSKKVSYINFYAIKNINLEIKKGESIGIIGRNGAGKTTLLRIIAGVYKPTEGKVFVKGKIMPIIELGAGFDMELTGAENIFINGLLLGMTRKEIEEKYEEIVEFSGLKDFINSPLRTYSSGMILRLGFSVATSLEPDIILLDEVFAVGDAEFREKCIKRMNEMKEKSATLLFVSHDMNAIKENCKKVIMLEKGEIKNVGDVNKIIENYNKIEK
ncbi:ABC transporter ATP-binding protein [bacterium]|nr:ABC transporter ATP-binding protein [bacterium]